MIPATDPDAKPRELPTPSRRTSDDGYYSSADYRALYLAKETTPSAVVEALLPLIRRDITPPGEHSVAFLESKIDLVRHAAAESTKRYEQGRSLGPLDGVPIAVKDEVDVAGYKRTVGSVLEFTGPETSWCVKVLEKAGAIVVGKTNMHEFGLGMLETVIFLEDVDSFADDPHQIPPTTTLALARPETLTTQSTTPVAHQGVRATQSAQALSPLPMVLMAVVQSVFPPTTAVSTV